MDPGLKAFVHLGTGPGNLRIVVFPHHGHEYPETKIVHLGAQDNGYAALSSYRGGYHQSYRWTLGSIRRVSCRRNARAIGCGAPRAWMRLPIHAPRVRQGAGTFPSYLHLKILRDNIPYQDTRTRRRARQGVHCDCPLNGTRSAARYKLPRDIGQDVSRYFPWDGGGR